MRKYGLRSRIRKKDPYKVFQEADRESRVAPNVLDRRFRSGAPYRKFGTDVTFLPFRGSWAYLSIVKDMETGEAPAWSVSLHPDMALVHDTIRMLRENVPENLLSDAVIHSDQGFQYTHPSYPKRLESLQCIQSMSRKGNCLDNAPTESFFGHMKDEIDISTCSTFSELEKYMNRYMYHYNNERPQWARKKMTPVEYRNHLLKTSGNP